MFNLKRKAMIVLYVMSCISLTVFWIVGISTIGIIALQHAMYYLEKI